MADINCALQYGHGQVDRSPAHIDGCAFRSAFMSFISAQPNCRLHPAWKLGPVDQSGLPHRLLTRLRWSAWSRVKRPFVIPWLSGLRVQAGSVDESLFSIFVTGRFEPNEFHFLDAALKPGMTFIDVGANLGLYSIFAARKVGCDGVVLAIEPSSREFVKLKRNVELNHLENARLLRLAVSDAHTEASLLVAEEEHAGHNTLGDFAYSTPLAYTERVRTESLDEIVRRENLKSVDVIKMDVEGGERAALSGATQTLSMFRPLVMIEVSDRALKHQKAHSVQIWEFFSSYGYRLYAFDEGTGLPVPACRQPYYDSANFIAVHQQDCRSWFRTT